jgi:hypothetical protein
LNKMYYIFGFAINSWIVYDLDLPDILSNLICDTPSVTSGWLQISLMS